MQPCDVCGENIDIPCNIVKNREHLEVCEECFERIGPPDYFAAEAEYLMDVRMNR